MSNIDYGITKHLIELLDRNKLIEDAVLDSLKQIAEGDHVKDIDIRKIGNIKHTKFLTEHIINPLERYAENKAYFKQKLQQHNLDIKTLEEKVTDYQDSVGLERAAPLLKTEEHFDFKNPDNIPEDLKKYISEENKPSTVEKILSPLHSDDFLGIIGSYLTAKDARVLKEAFSAPEKDSDKALSEDSLMDRPLDGSGGGGMTIAEMAEQAGSNQEDADFDAAISNSLQDVTFTNTGAAEEPDGFASEMTGGAAEDFCN